MDSSQGFEFYLIVTPGFEALALKEIERWDVPLLSEPVVGRGGITLSLDSIEDGFELNRVLKIPTRIVLRIAAFGCRDFPKLFKKMSAFPWEVWADDDVVLKFQASSHASRLFIKKRIEQTCQEARDRHLKNRGVKPPEASAVSVNGIKEQLVLVRLDEDVCTVSLDTSGEILHKRGTRELVSEAPIRETMASAMLQFMESIGSVPEKIELVDPMMGAGTFFLEAGSIRRTIGTRDFAYQKFNVETEEERPPLEAVDKNPYESFHGFDLNSKTLKAAEENLTDLFGSENFRITTTCADVFEANPLPTHPNRWLITNPPYGERLKVPVPLAEYYKSLFEACEKVFTPARACFVLPEKARPLSLSIPSAWKRVGDLGFSNGGLAVRVVVYERKHSRG
ncbi:MAG: hypothetical protein V4692_05535 [Bdellovibrionota bacterium]